MNITNDLSDIIQSAKEITLSLNEDKRLDTLKNDLTNVTDNAIQKAAKYVIKAMPVPDAVKDILTDVSKVLKTKDFNTILSTAVKSTVREGLEALGLSTSSIKSLMELKDVAKKGGLITTVKNGIEIVANNYLKDNIVANYVYRFFCELKTYIQSNDFMKKLNGIIKKLDEKKDEFLDKCEEWFKAYKVMDKDKINSIANNLSGNKYVLNRYSDCIKENNIIQNMTNLVNNKQGLLSSNQQRLCEVIG